MTIHFTGTKESVGACRGNAITTEYYNFLVGEINRGTINKTVASVCHSEKLNYITYHLISV